MPDRIRILLVDDEMDFLTATARIISSLGYDVECAVSGDEALVRYKFKLRPFDNRFEDAGNGRVRAHTQDKGYQLDPEDHSFHGDAFAGRAVEQALCPFGHPGRGR